MNKHNFSKSFSFKLFKTERYAKKLCLNIQIIIRVKGKIVTVHFQVRSMFEISLVPRPLPPEERPGTHCLRMREIFRHIFRKKLRVLPCPYAEDYINQEYRTFYSLATI